MTYCDINQEIARRADGTPISDRRYIAIDERLGISGDTFSTICDTLAQANTEANSQWWHLTPNERKKRHIYVGLVTKDLLPDYAIDDDGTIDRNMFCDHDIPNGAFDSATSPH